MKGVVEDLQGRIPRIAYIDRGEAFAVFPQAVQGERRTVWEVEERLKGLEAKARRGQIEGSSYKKEKDLLQAKHLKARIEVDLAILETMINSQGFSASEERLKELREKAELMRETVANLIRDIDDYVVSPKQVANTLNRVGNQQFQQLDNVLTNLAQNKITQIARKVGREKGYHLVIEYQNVILYRKEGIIRDLTNEVRERLRKELRPE